jgi:DNA mismatch endonuclease, patch repair protein
LADTVSKEQRRKNMQAIKSRSKLEDVVTKELWKRGIRYRKNVKSLLGKPDIAIKKYKIAVFIDSCFWHGCPLHGNMPKSNIGYWKRKLERNKERDKEVNMHYAEKNWHVLRIWEHEIKKDLNQVVEKIVNLIESAKKNAR